MTLYLVLSIIFKEIIPIIALYLVLSFYKKRMIDDRSKTGNQKSRIVISSGTV
jgi:flagellar biogenesis protein FliO